MKLLIKKFIIIIVFLNLLIALPSCGQHVEYDDFFGIGSFGPLEQYGSYVVSLREDGYYQIIRVTETQNDGVVVIPQYINGIPVYGIGAYMAGEKKGIFLVTTKETIKILEKNGYYMNLKEDPLFTYYLNAAPSQRIMDYLNNYQITGYVPMKTRCEIVKANKIYLASKTGINAISIAFSKSDVVFNYAPIFSIDRIKKSYYKMNKYFSYLNFADIGREVDSDIALALTISAERQEQIRNIFNINEPYYLQVNYYIKNDNNFIFHPKIYDKALEYNEIMLDIFIEESINGLINAMDELGFPYTDEEVYNFKTNIWNDCHEDIMLFSPYELQSERYKFANIFFKYNLTIDGKKYTNPNMSADFAFDITEYDTNRTISYVNEGDIIDYLKGIEIDDYWIDYSDYRTRVFEPPVPYVEGYEFQGWYKESECINKWDFQNDIFDPAEDLILYAKWQ